MECVARQAPLSMGFSRQEQWSGLSFPPPGDLANPAMEPGSLALQAESLMCEPSGGPPNFIYTNIYIYTHTHKGWHSIVSREGFPHPQDKGLVGPLDGVQEGQTPEAMQSSAE